VKNILNRKIGDIFGLLVMRLGLVAGLASIAPEMSEGFVT